MKKTRNLLVLSLVGMTGSVALSGCDIFGPKKSNIPYSFSVAVESGASVIEIGGQQQRVVPFNNGQDVGSDRSFTYQSTKPSVATIDDQGYITPVAPGRVNFLVTEKKSNKQKTLKKEILVVPSSAKSNGGYNYSGGTTTEELAERAEILGKLEKYAMDTHLTGITLFDNGGYVKHASRVRIPTYGGNTYIQGFGFGVLSDGELVGELPGAEGQKYKSYYHSSISQDSLKINMYNATGSQVSDLASYISSSYWGTKLSDDLKGYDWAPMLARDTARMPKRVDGKLVVTGTDENGYPQYDLDASTSENNDPFPLEDANGTNLYRKWRVYVKTDDTFASGLKFTKYTQDSEHPENLDGVKDTKWHGRAVTIEDYLFPYKLLLTGSNNLIRGTEMANDSSYGIKGAQRYYNETRTLTDDELIDAKWDEFIKSDKLGLHIGKDAAGQPYIDIELINPIDEFTAKYTLSSNLVSPLPESFFKGDDSISKDETKDAKTMHKSAEIYGTFNNKMGANAILDYTICCGPYSLTKWVKEQEIVFKTNQETDARWFEYTGTATSRYKIPGVYLRRIDTSSNSEKTWLQFEAGNLDSAGVPASQIKAQQGKALKTKGDATFKLNINSCTQEQWEKLFGENGTVNPGHKYKCKPWMSNQDFLDGLFYSIDRKAFADKRGVTPSVNYFSDAYQMRNSEGGDSYNETDAHKDAVKGYAENYGYNKDKAIDCFRNAVQQLAKNPKTFPLGTKEKPAKIEIKITWMYLTDKKDYGEDIKSYFESAFNNDAVCGGRVKLNVVNDAVTQWEEVYNVMMRGQFDLGFGAISGNTYNPLNFFEVLKSDNSSGFTLNWGPDTSVVDEKNPIVYDGKKWSFDALWEVADHGGIVDQGAKIKPVKKCEYVTPTLLDGSDITPVDNELPLYNGFKMEIPVEFAEGNGADFDVNRVDCYILGSGNMTLAEKSISAEAYAAADQATKDAQTCYYDRANNKIVVKVSAETAQEINTRIKQIKGFDKLDNPTKLQNNPFVVGKVKEWFAWELYYELRINNGSPSINYAEFTTE